MLTVPIRPSDDSLRSTMMSSSASPVPDEVKKEIHSSSELTSLQSLLAVMERCCKPPEADTNKESGLMDIETGSSPASWVTMTRLDSDPETTVTLARLISLMVLGSAVTVIMPSPVPVVADNETQFSSNSTVQSTSQLMVMSAEPPSLSMVTASGVTSK